jgi:hypothetical protein
VDRNRLIVPITPSAARTPASSRRSAGDAILAEASRVTPRDWVLLELLADHYTLTSDQLAAALFGSIGRARARLTLLHSRAILDRFRHYQRPGSQSWRWTLGPVGAALIAARRGQPMPRPATVRDATARLAMSPTLTHLLTTNGFFVDLLAHVRSHDEARLLRWLSESGARELTGGHVRPDAHGVWAVDGVRVPFWLETDLGTETLGRVVAKLPGYATLTGSRVGFPVLVWLGNEVREANLHAAMARAGVPAGLLVATACADHAADHGGPAGPVWLVAGARDRVSLAGLPYRPPEPAGGSQ